MLIAGVDLAWGEKQGDGVCLVEFRSTGCGGGGRDGVPRARILAHSHTHGDEALFGLLTGRQAAEAGPGVLCAFDAPMICVNESGRRPVDAEISRVFRAQHAGCYPVNRRLAPRPLRIAERLRAEHGFELADGPERGTVFGQAMIDERAWRGAVEVFPHPALVRFLELSRIIEYKRKAGRGRAHCEAEFGRLRAGVAGLLVTHFPWVETGVETRELLAAGWTKAAEDRIDALVCALIALWHVRFGGRRSERFGDLETGLVLLPETGAREP